MLILTIINMKIKIEKKLKVALIKQVILFVVSLIATFICAAVLHHFTAHTAPSQKTVEDIIFISLFFLVPCLTGMAIPVINIMWHGFVSIVLYYNLREKGYFKYLTHFEDRVITTLNIYYHRLEVRDRKRR